MATVLAPDGDRRTREQSRARYPDASGFVVRDDVRIFWERYGEGSPAILLMPTWTIVHSRIWKMQIPDLARRYRVVVFDPRGNGRSDRPTDAAAYAETEFTADAAAVLDATGTDSAVVVSLSLGAQRTLLLATDHPGLVAGLVFIGPALPLGPLKGREAVQRFTEPLETDEGWAKYNSHYWRRNYAGFLEFFFAECLSEAHSTKPIEDAVGWGLETDPETLILSDMAAGLPDRAAVLERGTRVRCPVLVIHGNDDHIRPHDHGRELAEATGGRLATIDCGGHLPNVRDPVLTNLLIRDFMASLGRVGP